MSYKAFRFTKLDYEVPIKYNSRTKRVEIMGSDICMKWDREHLDDKNKWETVELLGKKVKTPYMKEKWLETYFGKDYMTENKRWHYSGRANNRDSFTNLIDTGELWH